MIVSLVVAASANEVIGADGALPWHLPGDLRRFRELTTGHVVVMGRLTTTEVRPVSGCPSRSRMDS
jgi:dihydrofolate reductase